MRSGIRQFMPRSRHEFEIVLLGVLCLVALARVLWTLDLTYAFSNEGWTAYHAADAISGAPLYPAPGGLVYNNYPPLGFYLIGGFGALVGDTILAGRILSIVAFLVLALGVRQASLALGCGRREADFAALIFSATMLYDYDYVGVCDPQMVANAIQIVGLVLCLRESRSTATMALAALLFVAALFVKHALIVQPLAVTIWLLSHDRRNGLKLVLFGIAFGLVGATLFQWAYGRVLLAELNNGRVWQLSIGLRAIGGRAVLVFPLTASLLLLRWCAKDKAVAFAVSYFVAALLVGAYFLCGAGTGGKMLFDTVIALSLCAGVGLHRLDQLPGPRAMFALCQILPVIAYVVVRTAMGTLPHHWIATDNPDVVATAHDVAFLKARPGPVLCAEPALCFWAGKPFAVDLWGYQQALSVGARDGHEVVDAIRARHYAALQLGVPPNAIGAPPEVDKAWVRVVSAAIVANYRLDHSDANGGFWVRKKM